MRLAAWYHDSVYAGLPDDEERSARRAEEDLSGLGLEPQLEGVINAREMFFAGTDDPMAQSATADGNARPLEGLRQPVKRGPIDVFVHERKGQR